MDEQSFSSPPTLQELTERSARSQFLPSIIGFAAASAQTSEVIVILNPRTGLLTLIEESVVVDLTKEWPLPASRSSIDAMPVVEVVEDGSDCAICLTDLVIGAKVKEMPCKHKYHSDCIEKWLGLSGSCPVCRHKMPVQEDNHQNEKEGGVDDLADGGDREGGLEAEGEGEMHMEGEENGESTAGDETTFVFHIYFAGRRRRRNSRSLGWDNNSSRAGRSDDANSGSGDLGDMEIDTEQSANTDRDIDME